MTIAVKLIKGRHYGKRLYKAGKIYHVDQAEGAYLLAYRNPDNTPRFKHMVPKRQTVIVPEQPIKRGRGRPKKSDTVGKVVDEKPVEEQPADEKPLADLSESITDEDLVEEETTSELVEEDVKETQETETFDPSDANQEYSHEV